MGKSVEEAEIEREVIAKLKELGPSKVLAECDDTEVVVIRIFSKKVAEMGREMHIPTAVFKRSLRFLLEGCEMADQIMKDRN